MEDQAFHRKLALVGAIIGLAVLVPYVASLEGPPPFLLADHRIPIGLDFLNTWFYGQAFWDQHPGRFYDRGLYEQAIQAVFPANCLDHIWSYPPMFLLVAAPFGCLPYLQALALWSLLGLAALALSLARKGQAWRLAALLTAPTTLQVVLAGQISLFGAAIVLGFFRLIDRRPIVAGLLISLLSIKPQVALLVPVLLIASRRWRVFAAASVGVVAILALSVALNGVETWTLFFDKGLPAQAAVMRQNMLSLAAVSFSPASALRLMHAAPMVATLVQASLSLLAFGLVAYTSHHRKIAGPGREAMVFLAASAFASPYLLTHDLEALAAGALFFLQPSSRANKAWIVPLIYLAPLQIALGSHGLHLAFLIPVAFALRETWRLRIEVKASAPAGFVAAEPMRLVA